ncbi:hypothetical protein [Streptosporangium carneum]|uniref:Uncharacterized protein n=1 Tax=Streptosporangium carneum TaxID=47481 RepID=A0A9W6MFQ9_9ACTN|nr:hypothetical protein [Streptosporangium carneum]GLK12372.1 hypothetical protein GCM10017600_57820 [Streptosporangium carneum]
MSEPAKPTLQERLERIRSATADRPKTFPQRELPAEPTQSARRRNKRVCSFDVDDGDEVPDFLR